MQKLAPAPYPLTPLIAERWSPRAFADRPLDPGIMCSLLEAARWAPSSSNEQPWRFCVGIQAQDPEAHAKLAGLLMTGNALWATAAPVLILAIAHKTFEEDGSPNRHAQYDTGAAVMNLILQAMSLGVFAHEMAGFSVEKAYTDLGIPADYEPMAMIALGYPGTPEQLKEPFYGREQAPLTTQTVTGNRVYPRRWTVIPNLFYLIDPHRNTVHSPNPS